MPSIITITNSLINNRNEASPGNIGNIYQKIVWVTKLTANTTLATALMF